MKEVKLLHEEVSIVEKLEELINIDEESRMITFRCDEQILLQGTVLSVYDDVMFSINNLGREEEIMKYIVYGYDKEGYYCRDMQEEYKE